LFLRACFALTVLLAVGLGVPARAQALRASQDAGFVSATPAAGAEDGRACGPSEDPDDVVDCGGELLAAWIDPGLLRLRRGACSRFLEELFAGSACRLGEDDCGRLRAVAPPPVETAATAGAAAAGCMIEDSMGHDAQGVVARARRAGSEHPPREAGRGPEPPPPRR
jgi:hypothetical protein